MPADLTIALTAPAAGPSGAPPQSIPAADQLRQLLTPGQTVQAQILSATEPGSYLLTILGKQRVARSDQPLIPGQLLTLQVTQTDTQLRLQQVVAPPADLPAATVAGPAMAIAASLTRYGLPVDDATVARAVQVTQPAEGIAPLNVEATAFLASRGLPATPSSVTAAADLIFAPDGATETLQTIVANLASLAQSGSAPSVAAATEMTAQLTPPPLTGPDTGAALADELTGRAPADRLRQLLVRAEAAVVERLSGSDRLVRLDRAIRLLEQVVAQRPPAPPDEAVRVLETTRAIQEATRALDQSNGPPLLTDRSVALLNRTERVSLQRFLMTMERKAINSDDELRQLREVYSGAERLLARHNTAQAVTAATRHLPQAPLVAELLIHLPSGPAVAALKMYYRRPAKKQRRNDQSSQAVIAITTPNLGRIRAEAALADKQATVRFGTASAGVAETLVAEKGELADRIETLGFKATISVRQDKPADPPPDRPLFDQLQLAAGKSSIIDARG